MRDQYGYNYAIQDQIYRGKSRTSHQRLMIKAAANDNVSFETGGAHIRDAYVQSLSQVGGLKMDERSYEPAILYVNGQFWGLYEIREKVGDSDFTSYYYDQDEKYGGGPNDVQFLRTWGGTWEEMGAPSALKCAVIVWAPVAIIEASAESAAGLTGSEIEDSQ